MNLQKNDIKRYILRRYSVDELESIFNQKLNNQSRNFKHYAHMSSNKFMVIVVSSITEEILVQLTDGWVEDSPIPEEGLYEFIQEIFGERIMKKYDELTSMDLQETIRRILREESNPKQDLYYEFKHMMSEGKDSYISRLSYDQEYEEEYPKWGRLMVNFLDTQIDSYSENDDTIILFDENDESKTLMRYDKKGEELYWDYSLHDNMLKFIPFNYMSRHFKYAVQDYFKKHFSDYGIRRITGANITKY